MNINSSDKRHDESDAMNLPIQKARLALIAASLFCFDACEKTQPEQMAPVEILIKNGTVFTGDTKEQGVIADIAISAGEVVFIGDAGQARISAQQIVDASGLVVAPGFIDPHTHALDDLLSADKNQNINYLTQGVTTVFVGNDGDGPVSTVETLSALSQNKTGTNAATFIGHGSIRKAVLGGENRAPNDDELDTMRAMVRTAMEDGALGLSAGLYYAPASYAKTDELIALAEEVAKFGGVYDSHLRDESSYSIGLLAAVKEALTIGRESGAAVHIAHIKALGVDVWGQSADVIELIEDAQSDGQRVTADQYPWRASGTHVSNALIPNWAKEGSTEAFHERLRDPENKTRLEREIAENLRKRGGPEALLIVTGLGDENGMTLAKISKARGVEPIQTAIDIVLTGDARVASFNMREDDIEAFMREPWVMTSSDGTNGHPRKYASFPRKYAYYVQERNTLSLGDFIHRSTGLVAETFSLCDRGYIRKGYAADIVVFDPATFKDNADFAEPRALSNGVGHLFVNGVAAIDDGKITDAFAGKSLKRSDCSA